MPSLHRPLRQPERPIGRLVGSGCILPLARRGYVRQWSGPELIAGETPATCRHHRNSARQPFPRPRTANGAGRRTTTGTAPCLSRPIRSPAHRKRRSRCCASGRRWRNSGPMTRSPWPSGPWGSLWPFRRSWQKPKTGRAMPSAMHGRHGTMRGRRWTPRRRCGGLMRRGGVGGAGRGSGRLGGPRSGWRCYRSGYCWLLT